MALGATGIVEDILMVNPIVIKETMAYLPFLKERAPSQVFSPIEFINQKLGIPDPKFQIGDRVKRSYICDDEIDLERHGQLITFYGNILWMMPDAKLKRWEYFILCDNEKPKYFDCDLPYLDDELEAA